MWETPWLDVIIRGEPTTWISLVKYFSSTGNRGSESSYYRTQKSTVLEMSQNCSQTIGKITPKLILFCFWVEKSICSLTFFSPVGLMLVSSQINEKSSRKRAFLRYILGVVYLHFLRKLRLGPIFPPTCNFDISWRNLSRLVKNFLGLSRNALRIYGVYMDYKGYMEGMEYKGYIEE